MTRRDISEILRHRATAEAQIDCGVHRRAEADARRCAAKSSLMAVDPWYEERRERWRPIHVRLLLIAESAPDDGGDVANRRFFYDEALTGRDGLFREVIRALYDDPALTSGPQSKAPWLERLKSDGVYLVDVATAPVNYHARAERQVALKRNVDRTIELSRQLNPEGIVLVKQNIFDLLEQPLRAAGLPLLHHEFIPFPGSGQQKRFRERFAAALARRKFMQ